MLGKLSTLSNQPAISLALDKIYLCRDRQRNARVNPGLSNTCSLSWPILPLKIPPPREVSAQNSMICL